MHLFSPDTSVGKETVAFWENFLSPEDIGFILALPEWHNSGKGTIGTGQTDLSVRSSTIGWMGRNESNLHIWHKLETCVKQVNSRFFRFDLTGFYEGAQLGLYSSATADHYTWHIDSDTNPLRTPRKLSMALLLSDPSEFEGGELQIKSTSDTPVTLEQKQGRAWFFPSYTLHRVTPVTKGVRRSLVIWIGGPEFK